MRLSSLLGCKSLVCVIDIEILGRRPSNVRLGFGDCVNQIFTATAAKEIN